MARGIDAEYSRVARSLNEAQPSRSAPKSLRRLKPWRFTEEGLERRFPNGTHDGLIMRIAVEIAYDVGINYRGVSFRDHKTTYERVSCLYGRILALGCRNHGEYLILDRAPGVADATYVNGIYIPGAYDRRPERIAYIRELLHLADAGNSRLGRDLSLRLEAIEERMAAARPSRPQAAALPQAAPQFYG